MLKKHLYCSFCGKSDQQVQKLIAGPTVFICDECVALCSEIVLGDQQSEEMRAIHVVCEMLLCAHNTQEITHDAVKSMWQLPAHRFIGAFFAAAARVREQIKREQEWLASLWPGHA